MRYKNMDNSVRQNGTSGMSQKISSSEHKLSVTSSMQSSVLTKGNAILASKPNSVIQGNLQTLQVVHNPNSGRDRSSSPNSDKRRIVGSSPSRVKIENELSLKLESSGSDCDSNLDSELSSHSLLGSSSNHYHISMGGQNDEDSSGLPSIVSTVGGSTGNILHYGGQDSQYFVSSDMIVMPPSGGELSGNSASPEEQYKKREMRLMKNREAARECRRKKKEYIKCLENRVAVLETQNKALIEELKSLKELYCLQKAE